MGGPGADIREGLSAVLAPSHRDKAERFVRTLRDGLLDLADPEGVELQPKDTGSSRGRTRGERVVEAVLEAAPQCIPRIEVGRAPIEERKSFMMATRHLVHGAEARSGLLNIEAKVERFGGWLYGVVYAEGCTP